MLLGAGAAPRSSWALCWRTETLHAQGRGRVISGHTGRALCGLCTLWAGSPQAIYFTCVMLPWTPQNGGSDATSVADTARRHRPLSVGGTFQGAPGTPEAAPAPTMPWSSCTHTCTMLGSLCTDASPACALRGGSPCGMCARVLRQHPT